MRVGWTLVAAASLSLSLFGDCSASDLRDTIRSAQAKVVKIYGAGGLRRMEAYQSGIIISAEGHILTTMSYVLDTDEVTAVLDDGRKWTAQLVGSDPLLELAVLKIPDAGEPLPYFDLQKSRRVRPEPGSPIIALSNLYGIATGDEPVSALQGVVTAIAPLAARRGPYQHHYRGEVYVLDAYTNNPGAAGGALVDWQGRFLGVLGKELRSEITGTWLNYALPSHVVRGSVQDVLSGDSPSIEREQILPSEPLSPEALGFSLVPNVLTRTPPYVDIVHRHSLAGKVGLQADDLIVFVASTPVISCRAVLEELGRHERSEEVTVSVLREGQLLEFRLDASADKEDPSEVE